MTVDFNFEIRKNHNNVLLFNTTTSCCSIFELVNEWRIIPQRKNTFTLENFEKNRNNITVWTWQGTIPARHFRRFNLHSLAKLWKTTPVFHNIYFGTHCSHYGESLCFTRYDFSTHCSHYRQWLRCRFLEQWDPK